MHNKQIKYKTDCFVAGATGTVKLALWNDAVDQVYMGDSYSLQFLQVRIFHDAKYVNSNESTIVSLTDDI